MNRSTIKSMPLLIDEQIFQDWLANKHTYVHQFNMRNHPNKHVLFYCYGSTIQILLYDREEQGGEQDLSAFIGRTFMMAGKISKQWHIYKSLSWDFQYEQFIKLVININDPESVDHEDYFIYLERLALDWFQCKLSDLRYTAYQTDKKIMN